MTTVAALPTVSVIIPCRNNAATIRATVDSLLGQDYPALAEVILVGSTGDSTWSALADVQDPRLVMLEQENTPGKRDPNVKRDKGLRKASGEVLALADSDIVMDPDWLSRAIPRLLAQGGGVVAGGMKRIHDTFWGRFVDRNVLAAKTPRVRRSYSVTAPNFGTTAPGHRSPRTPSSAETCTNLPARCGVGLRLRGLRVVLAGRKSRAQDLVRPGYHRRPPSPPPVPRPDHRVPPVR